VLSVDDRCDPQYGLEFVNLAFEDIIWNDQNDKALVIRCANPEIATQFSEVEAKYHSCQRPDCNENAHCINARQ